MPTRLRTLRTFAATSITIGCLCFTASAQAPLDIRMALVIGNSAYPTAPLVNPANDARAMGDTLRGLGFTVVELRDASKDQMAEAIGKMREALKGKQAVGMLYYAGHGLQLDWRNYMVPVNASLSTAADVPAQTVDINSVIDAFKVAGNRMNILVLDACRDNPFGGTASGKGLAQLDAPPGTFLAYATAPGNVAEDGDVKSGNGLYTQFLLTELKKPVSRIEDVFKRVRFQVRQKSQGRQIPWESTSLEDDFFFNTGKVMAVARPDEHAKELAFAQQKAEWDKIKDSRNADDFYDYLKKYPSGLISDLALTRLETLQQARITAQADKNGRVQGAQTNTFRNGDRFQFVFTDGLTGLVTRRAEAVTQQIGPDLFQAAGPGTPTTIANQAGYVFKDVNGTYDPPWNVIPGGELAIGNKSSARSIRTAPDGSRQWIDVESRVVAQEKITTPLGTLDTYRVEVNFLGQQGWRTKLTFWYELGWSYSVRMRVESGDNRSGRGITVREVEARARGT